MDETEAALMADVMDRMQSRCRDCGHTCSADTMIRFCDGYKEELEEARQELAGSAE